MLSCNLVTGKHENMMFPCKYSISCLPWGGGGGAAAGARGGGGVGGGGVGWEEKGRGDR